MTVEHSLQLVPILKRAGKKHWTLPLFNICTWRASTFLLKVCWEDCFEQPRKQQKEAKDKMKGQRPRGMTLENIIREERDHDEYKESWKQPLLLTESRADGETKVKAEKREAANCVCVCSGRHDRDMRIYVTVCTGKTRTEVNSGNIRLQHQPRA